MEATLINHFAIYTHTLQDANLEKENDNDNDADSKHVLEVSHTQYSLLRYCKPSEISLHQADSDLNRDTLVAST
jgi:hypothetical protein